MNLFSHLKADHKKINALLRKIEKTTSSQAYLREHLFAQLKAVLLPHAKAEELAVYSALKNKQKTTDAAFIASEEHAVAEHLVEQLEHFDTHHEKWTAKMTVLKKTLELHIREEEEILFRKMRSAFEEEELEQMLTELVAFKNTLKFPAHPAAA